MLDIRNIGFIKQPYKPLHYWPIYQEVFEKVSKTHNREKPFKIFEIGVGTGGSIELWYKISKELKIDFEITAIDIRIRPAVIKEIQNLTTDDGSVRLHRCNSNNIELLDEILQDEKFDLIIDDGSHESDSIVNSFHSLFIDRLKDGGLYIIEDLHTHYWEKQATPDDSASNLVRNLFDAQNFWSLTRDGGKRFESVKPYFDKINKIESYDSIVLIHKGKTYVDRARYAKLGRSEDRYHYYGCPIGSPRGDSIRYGDRIDSKKVWTDGEITNEYRSMFDTWVCRGKK